MGVLYAVGGVGAAGAVSTLVFYVRWKLARRDYAAAMAAGAKLGAELERTLEVNAELTTKLNNQDNVTGYLKSEIAKLEGDLDACSAPGAVRDRLRGLLRKTAGQATPTHD